MSDDRITIMVAFLKRQHGLDYLERHLETIPVCCRRALSFVFELVEVGRLSTPEASALLEGIWPMRLTNPGASVNEGRYWEPLFRLAEPPTTSSERPAS